MEKEAFQQLLEKEKKTESLLNYANDEIQEKKRLISLLEKEKKNLKYKIEDILAESVSIYNSDEEDAQEV